MEYSSSWATTTTETTTVMQAAETVTVVEAEDSSSKLEVYDVASMPGFRFQPTEEELVGFYLRAMVMGQPRLEVELINVLDLYRYDPWELPAMAFMQGEREWLFFCPRDKKYPNGARPNRVTASGYWKATGTDRQVRRAHDARCIGLKKTLVFYAGKAPKGRKSEWIMNEYRLLHHEQHLRKLSALKDSREVALCRIYKKPAPNPSIRFDVSMEEARTLGAESSGTYVTRLDCRESMQALHNVSPCASTSRTTSYPTSPSEATEAPSTKLIHECHSLTTRASSQHQPPCVKMETGSIQSPYPCPAAQAENLDSLDALLAQLMEAEARWGRSQVIGVSESAQAAVLNQHELVHDQASCSSSSSNLTIQSTSFDRLLKASIWSSPLAMHSSDDLLPVSSSSLFSMNQFGRAPWLYSPSSLPSLLQIQGLQPGSFPVTK